jgi:hypothetical protein
MGTLAPVARRACAGPRPCAGPACFTRGYLVRLACGPGPSRYGPMVKFYKFGQPPRPWPPRVTNLSLFVSESILVASSASSGGRRCPRADSTVRTDNLKSRQSDTGESDHHRDHEHRDLHLVRAGPAQGRGPQGPIPAQAQLASLEVVMPGCRPAAPVNASESLRSTGHLNFSIRVSPRLPYPSQPETPRVGHGHCQYRLGQH